MRKDIDLSAVKLWQYDKADRINKIIDHEQEFVNKNVTDFWNNFIEKVFTIKNADEFGLTVWGNLLGVKRPTYLKDGVYTPVNDDLYKRMLLGKVMLMNSNSSMPSINRYIDYLFPDKPIFVYDYGNMTLALYLFFQPTDEEMAVFNSENFLPRPAGVKLEFYSADPSEIFGFAGQNLQNFDNGRFLV